MSAGLRNQRRAFVISSVGASCVVVLVLAACSTSKPPVAGLDSDSGIRGDVTRPPSSDAFFVDVPEIDAPVCVGRPNDAPIVVVQLTGAPPPTPKGGKIVPGKYHVVAINDYTGDGGATPTRAFEQVTMYISDTTIEYSEREGRIADDGGLSNEDLEDKGDAYTTAGTRLYVRRVCPIFGAESDRDYTAEGDDLYLFPTSVFVRIARRQP